MPSQLAYGNSDMESVFQFMCFAAQVAPESAHSRQTYPAFAFLTFVPMRSSLRTVPVGKRFIWS
jgi:hypothetical protein